MHDARAQAVHRLAADAEKRAANAVSDICFTTSAIMTGASDILSYGTAVVVEPE